MSKTMIIALSVIVFIVATGIGIVIYELNSYIFFAMLFGLVASSFVFLIAKHQKP